MSKPPPIMDIRKLKIHSDSRGDLVALNIPSVPFTVRRLFWITNVDNNQLRGGHSHIKCQQYFICVRGNIILTYCQGDMEFIKTLRTGDCLYVPAAVWASERFIYKDAVLLVLCSEEYDAADFLTLKPGQV